MLKSARVVNIRTAQNSLLFRKSKRTSFFMSSPLGFSLNNQMANNSHTDPTISLKYKVFTNIKGKRVFGSQNRNKGQ